MLSTIVAVAQNNAIGKDNKLLCYLPEDLKYFKEITNHKTIIMGRKTFQSLPKVLPGRKHIVITANPSYSIDNENVSVTNDLEAVFTQYKNASEEAFIIGGGDIYTKALPYCQKLYITAIYKGIEGDTFYPDFNKDQFKLEKTYPMKTDEKSGIQFQWFVYNRCL